MRVVPSFQGFPYKRGFCMRGKHFPACTSRLYRVIIYVSLEGFQPTKLCIGTWTLGGRTSAPNAGALIPMSE